MKYAMQIEPKVLNTGFHIERAEDIANCERFHLGVGAVISIHDNGTVMVQGKLKPKYKDSSTRTLKRILPSAILWHDK